MEDLISRQAINEYLVKLLDGRFDDFMSAAIIGIKDNINAMPPVTPTHGTCKDCKNGFQTSFCSSSVYGCEKHKGVYQYDFYCKDFKKRGSENDI